jgi:hypothetical protein
MLKISRLFALVATPLALLVAFGAARPALAAPSAEAKTAKNIENRDPVDESADFAAGETVHVWSRIKDANGTKVKHVWKAGGKELFTREFSVGSVSWRVFSRSKALPAGSYTVEILAEDGAKLSEVSFTVK